LLDDTQGRSGPCRVTANVTDCRVAECKTHGTEFDFFFDIDNAVGKLFSLPVRCAKEVHR
jgi:hypothetical protein